MVSWRSALALAGIAYPWLHPFARGSSPTIEPLLVGLACTTLLLVLAAASPARLVLGRGLLAALAAAAAAVWLGDIVARGTPLPSPGAVAAWMVLAGMAACAAVGSLARGEGTAGWHASLLAWAWLLAGLLSTLVALAQAAGLDSLLSPFAAHSPLRQAFGNLRQKNHYASLANIALLAAVWLVLHGRPALPRWGAALAAVLLASGTAAAASRTGALQLLLVLAVAALWHRCHRQSARWLLLPLAFYFAAAVVFLVAGPGERAGPALLSRVADATTYCTSRTVLWQNMLQLVVERPWLGWGWRELPYAFYAGEFEPRFCALLENAHNLPLHLAVELGLPVALAACAAVAWAVLRARPWRETDPARQLAWAVLLLLGLHSLVEYPLWYAPFQMALGLSLGLLAPAKALRLPPGAVRAWVAGFALFGGYAAWDHHRVSQLYIAPQERAARYQDRTLEHARNSWLFAQHADFAELAVTPLEPDSAARIHALSSSLLHFSPEPRVIEKNILSALELGREAEAARQMRRYRAAYPEEYQAWKARPGSP